MLQGSQLSSIAHAAGVSIGLDCTCCRGLDCAILHALQEYRLRYEVWAKFMIRGAPHPKWGETSRAQGQRNADYFRLKNCRVSKSFHVRMSDGRTSQQLRACEYALTDHPSGRTPRTCALCLKEQEAVPQDSLVVVNHGPQPPHDGDDPHRGYHLHHLGDYARFPKPVFPNSPILHSRVRPTPSQSA